MSAPAPWKESSAVGQPCWSAMTNAIVWLPLPGREMPIGAPLRSAIEWYLESVPTMTALRGGQRAARRTKAAERRTS
jgi:hypothetical protein